MTFTANPKRSALYVLIAVLVAGVAWLAAGVRRVPESALGAVDSALRGVRVVGPGTHVLLPGLERLDLFDPYRYDAPLTYRTPEGTRLDLRLDLALRLEADAARRLVEQGSEGTARDRLDAAIAGVVSEAVGAATRGQSVPELAGATLERVRGDLGAHGRIEGEMRLELDPDSIRNLAFLQARSQREIARLMQETDTRILIVGLDGADWQLAEPLIERGMLPHLANLRRRGAWGNIKALRPILSPLLWTSVATGVSADRHGILDFLVQDPDTGEQVPTNSRFRKVRALWNQFSEAGRTVDFVAWWATWPAEPINGHMISDRVSYSLFDIDMPSGGAGATHPPGYFDEIRPLLVSDDAIPYEDVAKFADVTREEFERARGRIAADRKAAYREPINHLTKILASTRNYHRIALDLIARGQSDLTAVYYQGIDEVCHRFIHYAPPALGGVDEADVARYGKVVERFYVYQDELLGELLAAVDPGTTVILLSDHGFINGPDRPAGETADIEGKPGRWHRPYGVLAMAGPPIRATKLDTSSLLDIAPTVLYLAGLPLPADGEGQLLAEAIRPDFAGRFEPTRVVTYDVTPLRVESSVSSEEMAAAEAEMLENLRSLGYIAAGTGGGGPDDAAVGDAAAVPGTDAVQLLTAHLNLAGVHLSAGRLAESEAEVRIALESAPNYPPALNTLFKIRMRQARFDEAIGIAEELLSRPDPGAPTFLAQVASAYLQADRAAEGIRLFRARVEAGQWAFGNPLSRLLLETGDAPGAERAALVVLDHDPLNGGAMAIAFRAAQAAGSLGALEPRLEQAIAINPRSVMHLNWMGVIEESRGDVPGAEAYLRRALDADPDHGASMANLGAFYARNGRAPEAVPLLERALRIEPRNLLARVNLGSALAYLERYDESIEQFEQVVADGTRSTEIYNALARANQERGDRSAAAEWLRRSLELDPTQEGLKQALARLESGS